MVQGDSPLSRPTKNNQYSSWGALSVVSPVVGIRGLPGSRHQGSGHAFSRGAHPKWTPHRAAPGGPPSPRLSVVRSPSVRGHQAPPPEQKADPPSAGAPSRRSSLHLPSGWARIQGQCRALRTAQSGAAAATRRRTTWVQARTGAHESAGGRPRGRSRTQAAPVASAAHLQCTNTGSPPAQRASAPPAGRAAASSQPRTAPVTRGPAPGGQDRTSAVPPSTAVVPLRSGHRTARLSASRHRFKVGPSGADPLSVRHARLRGHAPLPHPC
ncbi:hypothetical protein NDU88_004746 [Pleurodeles waltl]|uniref:Uncharacterized protein n=1 Tax=Pleurodeles waltl TaxID=8319 RepID=A0AAV7PDF7_PLEWA|nr:hypothetical protein NDU88_004746 [Pleurodeles waltl]